jgi:hypothetical protein
LTGIEFNPSIVQTEPPIHRCIVPISSLFPGPQLVRELVTVGNTPPIQTLPTEHTRFDFRHIQPAAMFWGVMEFQLHGNPLGFRWRKRFIQ